MRCMDATAIPAFTLTNVLYELAAAGVAIHAPSLAPLTQKRFTALADWLHIPDDQGALSKSELTLARTPALTVRLNIWFRPDLRGGDRPQPHNHPWETFTGHVLAGGYDEDRYEGQGGDVHAEIGVRHVSPAANTVDHRVYHEVTTVHEPGRTLSLMVCSQGRRGDWGYLDLSTGRHVQLGPDPDFDARFAALNPHRG